MRPLGERGAAPGPWLPAKVAWEDEALDAALIEILGPGAIGVGAAVFGEVVDDAHVTAVGFPISERRPDRVRDTDQATGEVLYGAGWKRNRLVFDVQSSVASTPPGSGARSAWEGISGAGLLVGNRLVGIVVADHAPEQHHGRRLEVVPIGAIVDAPGFRDVAQSLGVALRLDRVGAESRGRLEPASLPPGTVDRPGLRRQIADALAAGDPSIVAVVGPPGFGKSILALQACHDPVTVRRYPGGALWLSFGADADPAVNLARSYADLTGGVAGPITAEDFAQRIGDKLHERDALLVIDDVWNGETLELVLGRTGRIPRLVTTRNVSLVGAWADTIISIDEPLLPVEAIAVLARAEDVGASEKAALARMAERVGRWPLLLALTAGHLRRLTRRGLPLIDAVTRLEQQYLQLGVVAFDARRPEQRGQAVALTMAASLDQLPDDDRRRYITMSIFQPVDGVPLSVLSDAWDLPEPAAEDLALDLAEQSLLRYDATTRTAVLHQVIHEFLQAQLPDRAAPHRQILEHWGDPLTLTDAYRTTHVVWHMAQARQTTPLLALVDNPEWHAAQLGRDPSGSTYLNDLDHAWSAASETDRATLAQPGGVAPLLAWEIRCALIAASVQTSSGVIRSMLLVALVNAGLWTPREALASVRQNPHPNARGYGLTVLAAHLPEELITESAEIARGLHQPADASRTLAALVPFATRPDQAALASEALSLARTAGDATALASVGQVLPEPAKGEVLQEAWSAAIAIDDPDDRFRALSTLVGMLPVEHKAQLTDAVLEAARGIEEPVDRAYALIELLERPNMLTAKHRGSVIADAWTASHEIEDPDDRYQYVLSMATFVAEERFDDVLRAASDWVHATDNPHYWAAAVAAVVSVAARAPGSATEVLDEVRDRVHSSSDVAKVVTMAALTRAQTESDWPAMLAEADDVINALPEAADRATVLIYLLDYVPDAFRDDVLQRMLAAARTIEPMAARARGLRTIALYFPELEQPALLREAHEITPMLTFYIKPDSAEFVQSAVPLLPRVSSGNRKGMIDEVLAAARQITDPHDRGVTLGLILGSLMTGLQAEVAAEVVDAASYSTDDLEKGDCLTAAVPFLHGSERDHVLATAVTHVRDIDARVLATMKGVYSEEGIAELRESPAGALARARLFAALSSVAPPAERDGLVREALDEVYANVIQADAIAATLPYLPATAIRELLASPRTVLEDPLRIHALIAFLQKLAQGESPQAAHDQAIAIWGESIPATVSAALAPPTANTAAGGTPDDVNAESPTGLSEGDTVTAEVISDFPGALWRLKPPREQIMRITLALPPHLEPSRQRLEQSLLESYIDQSCAELPPDRTRGVLEEAAQFMTSPQWIRAIAALVGRLTELGDGDSAVDEVMALWGESQPARVFSAIEGLIEPDTRRRIADNSLRATWQIQDPWARADALAALLPYLADGEHDRARQCVEDAVYDRLKSDSSPDAVGQATELIGSLPPSRRLPLWQHALRAAARGTRRQLFLQLPGLIARAEGLGSHELYDQVAQTLVEIRHRW